jgi:hypothetical protein
VSAKLMGDDALDVNFRNRAHSSVKNVIKYVRKHAEVDPKDDTGRGSSLRGRVQRITGAAPREFCVRGLRSTYPRCRQRNGFELKCIYAPFLQCARPARIRSCEDLRGVCGRFGGRGRLIVLGRRCAGGVGRNLLDC